VTRHTITPAGDGDDTGGAEQREAAIEATALAVRRGELVVLPTDTVYGIAADAFDADAVQSLLDAKGRGRDMPPPVLVSAPGTIDALAIDVPGWARALLDAFWPGGLTLICHQQPSLQWDIGDTKGTVAVRMPDHPVTLEILERTGPLAVSSANVTGEPAATTADEAEDMLGDAVAVVLDDGPSRGGVASTIVDATAPEGRVLREGALSTAELNAVVEPLGATLTGPDDDTDHTDHADEETRGPVELDKEG